MNTEDIQAVGNLLAVMHGDGGHYQDLHGTKKAAEDAEAKYHNLQRRLDTNSEERMSTERVLQEVLQERQRQDAKWGQQNHVIVTERPYLDAGGPKDTREVYFDKAEQYKHFNDQDNQHGSLGWDHILLEEVFEALAEQDPAKIREELVQVAAVAVAAIESLDRNELARVE